MLTPARPPGEKREETEKAAAALEEKIKTLEADIQSGREQVEAFTRQVAEYGEKNEAMLKRRTQLEGETLSLRQQSRELPPEGNGRPGNPQGSRNRRPPSSGL